MSNNALEVSKNLNKFASNADKACMSQINKATTTLQKEMLADMASQIPVPISRLKKQFQRLAPASVASMKSGVIVKHRAIQLRNAPNHAVSGGVSVRATTSGGYKTIKHAYIGKTALKGSGVRGYIAMPIGKLIKMLERGKKSKTISARIQRLKKDRNKAKQNSRVGKSGKRRNPTGDFATSILYLASEAQMAHTMKEDHRHDAIVGVSFRDGLMLKIKGG